MKIAAVGFYPPPVDGQRLVTLRMREQLEAVADVTSHDLDRVPGLKVRSKSLSLSAALLRIPFWRLEGCKAVYLTPHSGAGLVGSLLLAAVARVFRLPLYVHYHSYKNFERRSLLMASFVALCGARATHIVLGPPMADALKRHYQGAREVVVLSNSAFVPRRKRIVRNPHSLRIGHLSNLSRVKGLNDVLDCMQALRAIGVDAKLLLAGPTADDAARQTISDTLAGYNGSVEYLGPFAQTELEGFFAGIDVFLFPSRYQHEAEPLVVLEALSFGVPVLATDRGCVRSMIEPDAGRVFETSQFASSAALVIGAWAADRDSLRHASECSYRRFLDLRARSRSELRRLLATIGELRSSSRARRRAPVGDIRPLQASERGNATSSPSSDGPRTPTRRKEPSHSA
jgi:glycosyltransferase involved in cell wall biosynthesis